jgi:hypothetical protein
MENCEVCGRIIWNAEWAKTATREQIEASCDWRTCHISQYDYQAECYRLGFERERDARAAMTDNLRGWVAINGTAAEILKSFESNELATPLKVGPVVCAYCLTPIARAGSTPAESAPIAVAHMSICEKSPWPAVLRQAEERGRAAR